MKLRYIFFVCLLSLSPFLYAKTYEYQGSCSSDLDPDAFEACLSKELSYYDSILNKMYKESLKTGTKKELELLKNAERLWMKFRDADCDFMAFAVNGGLEYQLILDGCLINKTKARIADLKRSFFYSHWFKND